jgi:hypothetical protein
MKALTTAPLGIALTLAATVGFASTARADDVVIARSAPPAAAVESSGVLPNRSLLRSGVFTLGASYIPALVVAIESDRPSDDHLYAPIVGPWLDLANRGDDCEGGCGKETVNKVLLVTDGVFQGIGALQILGSFIFPETRAVTIAKSDGTPALTVSVAPTQLRGGSGLVAYGNF